MARTEPWQWEQLGTDFCGPGQVQPQQMSPWELPRATAGAHRPGTKPSPGGTRSSMALQGDPLGLVLLFWGKNTRWEKALQEEEDAWAHLEDPSAEARQVRQKKVCPPLPYQEVLAAIPNSPQEKLSRAAFAT